MAIRVLLADDHPAVRQALRTLLAAEGFEIAAEAGDGRDAVRLAASVGPDVAVLDLSMPRLTGLDAAREPDGFASIAMKLSEYRKIEPTPLEEAVFFDHPSGRTNHPAHPSRGAAVRDRGIWSRRPRLRAEEKGGERPRRGHPPRCGRRHLSEPGSFRRSAPCAAAEARLTRSAPWFT